MDGSPLHFTEIFRCRKSRARVGRLRLKSTGVFGNDIDLETPIFMPVGTSGALKSVMPVELEQSGCQLMLCNTYHLECQPSADVVKNFGGLHSFIRWPNAILTDSGGFQMVSLSKLMSINEEGVQFQSPYQEGDIFLTPEKCIQIQHKLGSNIMMQLDDVVSSTNKDSRRFQEALYRSIRWYDRCLKQHIQSQRSQLQSLFPIVQGGLDETFRRISVREILARDSPGIAIGGLSGGEEKESFIKMISVSTEHLPTEKPRYLMGVGYALDMLLAVALGCDMFDCVFPTRTARFGTAIIGLGQQISLLNRIYLYDESALCSECDCQTCATTSRALLCQMFRNKHPVACQLLTIHNLRFQMRFMHLIREAIKQDRLPHFIQQNLDYHFGNVDYPPWIKIALDILDLDKQKST